MKEPNCSGTGRLHFKILAPSHDEVPELFAGARLDSRSHANMLFDIQVLRGSVYREYGPIAAQLLADGRHYQTADAQSWHIVLHDSNHRLMGCSRYRPVVGGFEQLGASQSAIAHSQRFGSKLREAIEGEIGHARRNCIQFGEVGAWALRSEVRCSTAAVNIALMTFVLAESLGGGLGITTATTRHHSASILRRLGGRRLADLPAYYDPKYGCVIEILHFSSANLDPQFADRAKRLRSEIERVPVLCGAGRKNTGTEIPSHFYDRDGHASADRMQLVH
ncbi:MAG TPA: hypothetical protein VG168_02490 [Bryobacteraceae bacterium]|nr:hypothetical protein [Bryobacteraceae bacterium]